MQQLKHISELSTTDQEVLAKARTNFIQAKIATNISEEMKQAGKELSDPVLLANQTECVIFSDGYKIYRLPSSKISYNEKQLKEVMLTMGIAPQDINAILSKAKTESPFVKVYGQETHAENSNSNGK